MELTMQHITTKSSHRGHGRKVYARASGGASVRLAWDYGLSAEDNHHAAARKLVKKLGWAREVWVYSGLWRGGFVYINAADDRVSL